MAKEKEELLEDEEIEETEEKTTTPRKGSLDSKKPTDFKKLAIDTVKGIIADYKELMKNSEDEILLKGFEDETRSEEECVNYIMNNLVKENIFCGKDSLMYPYIHDYYVDELDKSLLLDNWSSQIRGMGGSGQQQVRVQKPTQKDILEAYDALDNEKKNEIYQEQLKRAEEEAFKKAQAKIKAEEEKAKEKAKLKAEAEKKKKEEEKKAKEEALKNGAAEQMSLFDF
ncbi:MAG: hypothetical protein IKP07_03640 [Bacilli bacterium]|nr:hypothetical protein [Bacilli bacterium]